MSFRAMFTWTNWVETTGLGVREKAGMALNPCFSDWDKYL